MPPTSRPDSHDAAARRLAGVAVALAALPAFAGLALEVSAFGDLAGFPLDDPWIHLAFARRLATGDGLAYGAGELVAGTTAPLWTALLAFVAPLGPGAAEAGAKLLALAAHVAGLALVFRLARRLELSPRRAALATLLVGLSDGLVLAVAAGLEVPLFVALFAAGMIRHLDERADPGRPPVSFLLWALAALARPEGLLLLPLAAADRALVAGEGGWRLDRSGLRAALAGLALAAVVLVPVGLAFTAMSGSPLPTTFAAKSGGAAPALPPLRHLAGVFSILFAAQPLPALLALGGAVELARRSGGPRDRGLLLPLWTLALPLAVAALSGAGELLAGNFGRYLFPLLPCVVLLGLLALEPLRAEGLAPGRGAARLVAGAAALLLLVAPAALRTARAAGLALQARANVEASDARAADWLAAHAPADALVATVDVGLLGWRLPNPLLDLGGIVSPERGEWLERERREHGRAWAPALLAWIEARRPEYVVVFPRWFPLLEAQPGRFPARVRFRIERNVAMAGDELVIYATPWTRPTAPER
jgi:arabinofuranosyltransferase